MFDLLETTEFLEQEKLSIEKKMQFYIASKEKKGAKWIEVTEKNLSLRDALIKAHALTNDFFELGVFFQGYLYWTTKFPILNSTIINNFSPND